MRWRAAYALGKLNDPEAIDVLVRALTDESIPVRHAAAEALGKLGDTRAIGPLGKTRQDQNNPEYVIRADAYESRMLERLGQLGPPAHDSTPQPEAETAMAALGPPASWCAHCDDALGAVVVD